eukprot:TRINITY_DN838_c0_g1_i1.p1 TRINITY_DN838_c0_g1~~TRINITY_DN838_c0_g1_i1.p1  ORF type:complete len:542 (-),score=106.84 TRINITY_DN838_c0_g1_i1:405-2030(-)
MQNDRSVNTSNPSRDDRDSSATKLPSRNRYFTCTHQQSIFIHSFYYCQNCGLNLSKNLVCKDKSFKTERMNYGPYFNPTKVLEHMLTRKVEKPSISQPEYLMIRPKIVEWMFDNGQRLKYTLNTIHIAIYMLDVYIGKNPSDISSIYLYAVTALLVGAKSCELDMRIPFISKLKRVTNVTFQTSDIKRAELRICEAFNWNLQNCTMIDILEFYLSQGVVFSSDEIDGEWINVYGPRDQRLISLPMEGVSAEAKRPTEGSTTPVRMSTIPMQKNYISEKRLYDIISHLERRALKLASLVLRDNEVYEIDMHLCAAASLAFLRKLFKITPIWKDELKELTGFGEEAVIPCLNHLWLKFERSFDYNHYSSNTVSPKVEPQPRLTNVLQPSSSVSNVQTHVQAAQEQNSAQKPNQMHVLRQLTSDPNATTNNAPAYTQDIYKISSKTSAQGFYPTNRLSVLVSAQGLPMTTYTDRYNNENARIVTTTTTTTSGNTQIPMMNQTFQFMEASVLIPNQKSKGLVYYGGPVYETERPSAPNFPHAIRK